jgi:type I restriction enzyme S subunit
MIAGLKPYVAYKDSGQGWLGRVPKHWDVLPNRAVFDEVKDRSHASEQMLSVTITRGIVPQLSLLADSSKKDSSNTNKGAYKLVTPGDIAYNKMRAWQGALGTSRLRGIVSPAYVVLRPRTPANPWFFHHLYRTPGFAKEAERWSYGITSDMWSLRPEHFKVIGTVLPPLDEQAAIVRFLDHANRKIDSFIRTKRKLIALLNEQKQAIIHRAVTRGLDPDVPLKPSGIEWLGDIPAHWNEMPMRHLLSFGPKNGVSPPAATFGGVLSFSISAVRDGRVQIQGNEKFVQLEQAQIARAAVEVGDIMLVRGNGNVALVAKCGLVAECPANCVYPDILMKLRSNDQIISEFMVFAVNSSYVSNQVSARAKTTNGAFKVSGATVGSLSIVVPSHLEQEKILAWLATVLKRIDVARKKATSEIDLMKEYRTRLTADIVTGKLDVRAAAASLPEFVDEPADEAVIDEITDELAYEDAE